MFATSSSVDSESIWTEMTSASSSPETGARPEEAELAAGVVVVVAAGVVVVVEAEPEPGQHPELMELLQIGHADPEQIRVTGGNVLEIIQHAVE